MSSGILSLLSSFSLSIHTSQASMKNIANKLRLLFLYLIACEAYSTVSSGYGTKASSEAIRLFW